MKSILLIHDIFSSINDIFLQTIIKELRGYKVIAPELPVHPEMALEMLKDIIKEEKPELIVGWLSGAFFAQQLSDFDRVIVSPDYQPSVTLSSFLNGHRNINLPYISTRCTGEKNLKITPALIKEYAAMENRQFDSLPNSSKTVYSFFWFGTNEENQQIHQQHYHDICFLPGKNFLDSGSIQHICNNIREIVGNTQQ